MSAGDSVARSRFLPDILCACYSNRNFCQSPEEMAITRAEGSPMGPLLRAVNAVAASIEEEFPNVLVDTLACESPFDGNSLSAR